MHVWLLTNWKKHYQINTQNIRTGIRIKFDKDVHSEVRRACKEFLAWLRTKYVFPIRIPIYVKSKAFIKALDGTLVSATCFLPFDKYVEPYIRVAAGDYVDLKNEIGNDSALAAILGSIIHELTHYFQWVNDIKLTENGYERQAKAYVKRILSDYAEVREHP